MPVCRRSRQGPRRRTRLRRGVGLHVILGIAVTDAGTFAYVGIILANPAAVNVSLAVAPANVAAVNPD